MTTATPIKGNDLIYLSRYHAAMILMIIKIYVKIILAI